jgi:hypothetical protein
LRWHRICEDQRDQRKELLILFFSAEMQAKEIERRYYPQISLMHADSRMFIDNLLSAKICVISG